MDLDYVKLLLRLAILNIVLAIFQTIIITKNYIAKYYPSSKQQRIKIPKHIAFCFTNEMYNLDLTSIVNIVYYCKKYKIQNITLYDELGKLKQIKSKLFALIKERLQVEEVDNILILSKSDGRQSFIEKAKDIVKYQPSMIDIEFVNKNLGWNQDPELMIVFGNPLCLYGFPPWQIRLTEIIQLPTHINVSQKQIVSCLCKFASITVRLGK